MNAIEIVKSILPYAGSAVSAICGGVITAIFLRNKTSVEEFEKIKAGRFEEATEELLASGRMTYSEFYKARNFLSIAKKADQYHEENQMEEIDSPNRNWDWFMRFYDAVGTIGNEEMQDIWARLLSGEINHPSTYSFHTIDTLKNMSTKDAHIFEKICKHSFCVMGRRFVLQDKEFLKQAGIYYSEIMLMNEYGLINDNGFISQTISFSNDYLVLDANERLTIVVRSDSEQKHEICIQEYPFTTVGMEIASLSIWNPSDNDIMEFARVIKNENKKQNFYLGVHEIVQHIDQQFMFKTESLF